MPWFTYEDTALSPAKIREACEQLIEEARSRISSKPNRVLLLPPDLTRAHSGVGKITEHLYTTFAPHADVHVIPTLGQHRPHTREENRWMFGSIPHEKIHEHLWRDGCVHIGDVPAEVVEEHTKGRANQSLPIWLDKLIFDTDWDLIINVGHVVPHEVLGFANHNKNYFIGLGGLPSMASAHMISAQVGIENNLGRLISDTRSIFNWAEEKFLSALPDVYLMVVTGRPDAQGHLDTIGIYAGDDLETYLAAAKRSAEWNITLLDQPAKKIVLHMQADEFRSTWVANKAIYRSRLAVADGGELVVIAPGVEQFGEQPEIEKIIRTYGYATTPEVMAAYHVTPELQTWANGTAHLMNGSSEGSFTITYCPSDKLSRTDIEQVKYHYCALATALERYPAETMEEGWNTMPDGEEVFYIRTPAAGLWATKEKWPTAWWSSTRPLKIC
ncbi:MAG: lactate racemase domain-containing protein [Verrucomicrobiales bacterium]